MITFIKLPIPLRFGFVLRKKVRVSDACWLRMMNLHIMHLPSTVRNVMPDQLPKTLFYLLEENVQMAIKGLRFMHGLLLQNFLSKTWCYKNVMNNNQFFLILHIISIDDLKTVDEKIYFASYFQNQFYLNDQDHRYGYNGLFM